jgi:hypothetical protein
MSALVDRRTEMSIEDCTSLVNNLQIEIAKLEAKIDALTMALNESRAARVGPLRSAMRRVGKSLGDWRRGAH